MNVSIEDKKAEAVARMKMLGIFPETIRQFERDGYVSISEPPFGAFYWAEGEDLKHIREFEGENDALVYVVIRSYTNVGKTDSYLYVSDYRDEWASDRWSFNYCETIAYVYNHDMSDCSEAGYIGIAKTVAAGLLRTY